jgi:hypothetical protein
VPEGAPMGTSGYPVFMIFGLENVIFCGREQHLDHAAPVESGSPLPGASPISESVQKVVKKHWTYVIFLKSRLRSSPSFFYTKQLSKSTSEDPPGRPLFNFCGRWIFTRYSEIVTFPIWGSSGRRVGRARAGAFSGTLARSFFPKPWGDFTGNPQLILTIPFWSLFENQYVLRKKRVSGGPLLVVLGRWICTRSNEIVTFSFLERFKIERSCLALSKKRKNEISNIIKHREQKTKISVAFLE